MESGRMRALDSAIRDQGLAIRAVLVVRGGCIVHESYFPPVTQDSPHMLYSVTKSVISALVGIAIQRGELPGVETPIADFFPEYEAYFDDPLKQKITIEHLLTMTSGLQWEDEADIQGLYRSRDWLDYILMRPMAAQPGTQFNYNSGSTHLLSHILARAAGMDTQEYARQVLFDLLGVGEIEWERDRGGVPIGGWGLSMTAQDMARFGYLYLREGDWQDQQVVSPEWVAASITRHKFIENSLEPWDLYYGYGWWLHEDLAFAAHGRYGQYITVFPEQDLVVVFASDLPDIQFLEPQLLMREYILPALGE
jgi:CubicO group peptidase (beta-lactamase class C family)